MSLKVLVREVFYQARYALPVWLVRLLTELLPNNRVTVRLRGVLYRPFFAKCGRNLQVASGVHFLNSHGIEIGDDVYISYYAWLNGLGGISVGDEVVVGPFVSISSLTHCYRGGSFRFGGARASKVEIGKGTWLAAHVSVSYGVSVGSGCLVAANAAVVRDLPSNCVAGGVPAQEIGKCEEQEPDMMSRSGWKTSA